MLTLLYQSAFSKGTYASKRFAVGIGEGQEKAVHTIGSCAVWGEEGIYVYINV